MIRSITKVYEFVDIENYHKLEGDNEEFKEIGLIYLTTNYLNSLLNDFNEWTSCYHCYLGTSITINFSKRELEIIGLEENIDKTRFLIENSIGRLNGLGVLKNAKLNN